MRFRILKPGGVMVVYDNALSAPYASSDPLPDNDDYRSRHVAPYAAKNAGAR